MRFLILNGPNLQLTGTREPQVYGPRTLADAESDLKARFGEDGIDWRQSNHEGVLIDWLSSAAAEGFDGIVINPGGLSHTSVALADALRACTLPVVEVHISNIHAREPYRQHTLTGAACRGVISGLGLSGYGLALQALREAGSPA